jgi:hypothetical protein
MKPTALLITMDRYPKVRELLEAQQASAPTSVEVRPMMLAKTFEEMFTAMREPVDLIALDGHGFAYQGVPFFGTDDGNNGVEFAPSRLRDEKGNGIVAPIVALAFCHGGTAPFQDAVRASCHTGVVMLGSRHETDRADAKVIYPALFAALAEIGTSPAPEDARLRMRKAAETIGRGWHSKPPPGSR